MTLERSDGKHVWGVLEIESTGLELRYRNAIQDENHVESSYILFFDEYEDIRAIFRYADELSQENREKDFEMSFQTGFQRRLLRQMRHFISTASSSLSEVFGLLIGRLRKPAGRYIIDLRQNSLKKLGHKCDWACGNRP